jgi:hypothetical protein
MAQDEDGVLEVGPPYLIRAKSPPTALRLPRRASGLTRSEAPGVDGWTRSEMKGNGSDSSCLDSRAVPCGLRYTSSFAMIPVVPDCLDELPGLRGHVDSLALEFDERPSESAEAIR